MFNLHARGRGNVNPGARTPFRFRIVIYLTLALSLAVGECAAQTNAITYQGRLSDVSGPANGQYDFTFQLFDAPSGGNQVNLTLTNANVAVSNGLFMAQLNFGAGAFPGTDRWLQAGVRTNGSTGDFAILAPRQLVTPTPYSLYAPNAATAVTANSVASNSVTGSGIQDSSITATKVASGQVVKSINGLFDGVTISPGPNVTLTPSGNGFQIAASGGTSLNSKGLNIIFEGDSLTQEPGTGTDVPHEAKYATYPLYLRQMWGTNVIASWTNYAYGGTPLSLVTNRLSTVLANVNRSASNTIEFLWIGANDFIPVTGSITDAPTWLNAWQWYCSNIQSAGINLVAFTITDRSPAGANYPYNDFRTNVNAGIRMSPYWDYLVDMDAANPTMNTNTSLGLVNPRTYDGTHPNTNGAIWQSKFIDHCVPMSLGLSTWLGWFTASYIPPPTSDTDYVNFVNRAGITDAGQQAAIAALLTAAKTHGWWTNCDAIYPFVGGTATSCAQNLRSANYPLTFSGNVWYTNGIVGDGLTGYADTGFNPASGASVYQPTNCHLFAYIGSVDTNNTFAWMGCGAGTISSFAAGAWIGSAPNLGSPDMQTRLNCSVGNGTGYLYPGPCIATRTNNAAGGYAAHFDTKANHDAGAMQIYPLNDPVSTAPPDTSMALLGLGVVGGGKANFWSGPMLGATIGGGMTPSQWSYFWQDWRTFQMALGRNP